MCNDCVYSENVPEGFATSLLPLGKLKGTGDRFVNTSAGGIVTDSINLLNNASIAEAGGFTLETRAYRLTDTKWFLRYSLAVSDAASTIDG